MARRRRVGFSGQYLELDEIGRHYLDVEASIRGYFDFGNVRPTARFCRLHIGGNLTRNEVPPSAETSRQDTDVKTKAIRPGSMRIPVRLAMKQHGP